VVITKEIRLAYKDAHELIDAFQKITGLLETPLGTYITEIKNKKLDRLVQLSFFKLCKQGFQHFFAGEIILSVFVP